MGGISYFRKQHFYKNITTKTKMINLFRTFIPFVILIALALSVTMTALMVTGSNIHGYTELYEGANTVGQIFLAILLFIDSIYSYLTFSINACVFIINMMYQKSMVSEYARNLDNYIISTEDQDAKVQTIAYDYFLTKDGWDATVGALNYFFVFLNFFGFLSIYFYLQAIGRDDIAADEITNLILFVLIDAVYIVSINNVYRDVGHISDTIGSTSMSAQYFTNEKDDFHTLKNAVSRIQRLRQLDQKVFRHNGLIDEEMGVAPTHVVIRTDEPKVDQSDADHSDSVSVTGASHATSNSSGYKFDDFAPGRADGIGGEESYVIDPNVTGSLRKILTTVTGTQNMVNWMSLQAVAGGRWKTFRLFGVELTDTTLIARLVGLLIALGIGAELVSALNWY